jgi:6-phosphofructokinase 1
MAHHLEVRRLGRARFASGLPERVFVGEGDTVLFETDLDLVARALEKGDHVPVFERAGPRSGLFFDPAALRAGIVTCGGLCPGLNDVIRAVTLGLWHNYGVREIFGFRFGYEGLNPAFGHAPIPLDPELVDDIHQHGGTVLGSSRGPQPPAVMVDYLVEQRIDVLFTVGGDGTQRGALALADEIERRALPISVVGIPKTIDNDIALIERSFGFETAVAMAREPLRAAHAEAKGCAHGIGLVKLMGRESGFIAAYATLANSEVDVTLVPEVPFSVEGTGGLLAFLQDRLRRRRHAVVVVAEGAGQELLAEPGGADASGNKKLADVGPFLKELLQRRLCQEGTAVTVRYIDPSYTIRSAPAIADDSVYCLELGQAAVHAALSGRTAMIVGRWNGQLTHVPIAAAVGSRKRIDPDGPLWEGLCLGIGQPMRFG